MSLIGHWPLNEWSGRANDVSGNGNHGTVNGATQGVWGPGGLTSYSFDGNDDNVSIPDFNTFDAVSIAWWSRHNAVSDTNHDWNFSIRRNNSINFRGEGDGTYVTWMGDNSSTNTSFTGNLSNYTWDHWAMVWDGSVFSFYRNGSLVGAKHHGSMESDRSSNTFIGSDNGGGRSINGQIADFRVYDRALSPSEVQTLYEMGSGDYTKPSLHDGTDSGAVSRYEFESGSVTTDSWGSNTLTDNTSTGYVDGVYGQAKDFDGTDDYVEISDDSSLKFGSGDWTLSCWFNYRSLPEPPRLVNKRNSSDFAGYGILLNGSGNPAVVASDGTDGVSVTSSASTSANVWYHITGQRKGDTIKVYLNGFPVDSGNISSVDSTDTSVPLHIGAYENNNGNYIDGQIDDVRIYDRALSSAEIAQLYRQKHGKDMRKELVKK